jgi:SynChlorMet cassette protein ScmC
LATNQYPEPGRQATSAAATTIRKGACLTRQVTHALIPAVWPDDRAGEHYNIRLANGDVWCLTSAEETASWTATLAALLGIDKRNEGSVDSANIIIQTIHKRAGPERSDGFYPITTFSEVEGWHVHDFGQVRTKRHTHAPCAAAEVFLSDAGSSENNKRAFSLFPFYEHVSNAGGFPLHTALLEWQGKSCLLAGRSGTGKSTSCRRLPATWRALCDDEVLIIPGPGNRYYGHPLPTWSRVITGTERPLSSVNESRRIDMLFLLEQHGEDEISSVGSGEALFFVLNLAMDKWRRFTKPGSEDRRTSSHLIFRNVTEFLRRVPVRRLRASLDGQFWMHMEQALRSRQDTP